MTTTIPTPYDAELEALRALGKHQEERWMLRDKAEDAALLEAAKRMLAAIQRLRVCPLCKESECNCWADSAAAFAQARGEE